MIYLWESLWIKWLKRETWSFNLNWDEAGQHAWVSYIINNKKYIFDPTNELVFSNMWKMKLYWHTNLFKVPEDIASLVYFENKDIDSYTKTHILDKKNLKEKIFQKKDKILNDIEKNPYWIHNNNLYMFELKNH